MMLLHALPVLMAAVLATELVVFGLLQPARFGALWPASAAGLAIVCAWLAASHGLVLPCFAAAGAALGAHLLDLLRRLR